MTDKTKALEESAQWLEDCAECMEEEGLDRENNARHFRAGAKAIRAALQGVEEVEVDDALIDLCAKNLWLDVYPSGGSIYKTYESLPFCDKECYRKDARSVLRTIEGYGLRIIREKGE